MHSVTGVVVQAREPSPPLRLEGSAPSPLGAQALQQLCLGVLLKQDLEFRRGIIQVVVFRVLGADKVAPPSRLGLMLNSSLSDHGPSLSLQREAVEDGVPDHVKHVHETVTDKDAQDATKSCNEQWGLNTVRQAEELQCGSDRMHATQRHKQPAHDLKYQLSSVQRFNHRVRTVVEQFLSAACRGQERGRGDRHVDVRILVEWLQVSLVASDATDAGRDELSHRVVLPFGEPHEKADDQSRWCGVRNDKCTQRDRAQVVPKQVEKALDDPASASAILHAIDNWSQVPVLCDPGNHVVRCSGVHLHGPEKGEDEEAQVHPLLRRELEPPPDAVVPDEVNLPGAEQQQEHRAEECKASCLSQKRYEGLRKQHRLLHQALTRGLNAAYSSVEFGQQGGDPHNDERADHNQDAACSKFGTCVLAVHIHTSRRSIETVSADACSGNHHQRQDQVCQHPSTFLKQEQVRIPCDDADESTHGCHIGRNQDHIPVQADDVFAPRRTKNLIGKVPQVVACDMLRSRLMVWLWEAPTATALRGVVWQTDVPCCVGAYSRSLVGVRASIDAHGIVHEEVLGVWILTPK
mmetsp:Transcript_83414/g.226609  ORF Transcript_83414/g.226609 Transcript_83414/m.226609 type:complete len:577 (-) Transcript_83414:76-1806(-)